VNASSLNLMTLLLLRSSWVDHLVTSRVIWFLSCRFVVRR
jgi:hypothetical protein